MTHSVQLALLVAPKTMPDEPGAQLVQLAGLVAPTIDDHLPGGQKRHAGADELDEAEDGLAEVVLVA